MQPPQRSILGAPSPCIIWLQPVSRILSSAGVHCLLKSQVLPLPPSPPLSPLHHHHHSYHPLHDNDSRPSVPHDPHQHPQPITFPGKGTCPCPQARTRVLCPVLQTGAALIYSGTTSRPRKPWRDSWGWRQNLDWREGELAACTWIDPPSPMQ